MASSGRLIRHVGYSASLMCGALAGSHAPRASDAPLTATASSGRIIGASTQSVSMPRTASTAVVLSARLHMQSVNALA